MPKYSLLIALALLTACGGGGGGGGKRGGGGGSSTEFQCTVESDGQFSISGTVTVAQGSILDSDTLVFESIPVDNGSFGSAQIVPSPITVGGFLTTDTGQVFANGEVRDDINDYYRVQLSADSNLVLQVGDYFNGDLDLYLYKSDDLLNPVGASLSTGPLEVLAAPEDGEYFIQVQVFAGESNYVLSIGNNSQTSLATTNNLEDLFVPGEVIVQYRQEVSGLPLVRASGIDVDDNGVSDMEVLSGAPDRMMRMRMPLTAAASSSPQPGELNAEQRLQIETLLAAKRLQRQPEVEYASVNYIRYPTLVPDDPAYAAGDHWHYDLISLPAAWDATTGDPGVIVAVIDTGIKSSNPDLANKIVGGYDFVSDRFNAADGGGIDADPFDPSTGISHGTHVAGTVGAHTNNGVGVSGAAWDVSIMPVRALGLNGGSFYDIAQAMLYAAGLPNDSNTVPEQRADVINMSLGGPQAAPNAFEQSVINQARAQGVIVVAAAGNQNNSLPFYPASYDGVVSVSAVARPAIGQESKRAPYSSFGATIDVAAPGGDSGASFFCTPSQCIVSTATDSGYTSLEGTSMASPHVAGVVALMQSARRGQGRVPLTPLEFDQLLQSGDITDDLGPTGRDDEFGIGLINAALAVEEAVDFELTPPPPELGINPDELNFRADLQMLSLSLNNLGAGELQVLSVTEQSGDIPWLAIQAPNPLPPDGLGTYMISVDRGGLIDGDYAGEIMVEYLLDQTQPPLVAVVPVIMSKDSNAGAGQVGVIDVELFIPGVFTVATGDEIRLPGDGGAYEFNDIDAGCYFVAAGTHTDEDGFLSDVGEAWGVYTDKSDFSAVELDQDATGIDIEVSFDQSGAVPTNADPTAPDEMLPDF